MKRFKDLYNAGSVKRYHTTRTVQEQNLAAHSWGVALILCQISEGPVSPHLMLAALTHDLAESLTGDVPYPAKRLSRALDSSLKDVELAWEADHGIVSDLTEEEYALLKWADMFELACFAKSELAMGNSYAHPIMVNARLALRVMDFPTDKAADLYAEMLT